MAWSEFCAQRDHDRTVAATLLVDASAVAQMPGWRLDATSASVVHDQLQQALWPGDAVAAAAITPTTQIKAPKTRVATEHAHHRHLCRSVDASDGDGQLAAAMELLRLGRAVERRERAAWAMVSYEADAQRDTETASMWADWFTGNPWMLRDRWDALFLKPASRAFLAVCESRELPRDVRDRALRDLQEGFYFRLLGARGQVPGWAELAVRVIETSGPSPVTAIVRTLDDRGRRQVAHCLCTRGGWQDTAGALFDVAEPAARARQATSALEDADALESWLDLHVIRRLVNRWSARRPADWSVVAQNRGRARGRLRAVLGATAPDQWMSAVLELDSLYARTRAATARYAWAWAWQELSVDFSFDATRPVTPPCTDVAPDHSPLSEADQDALRTWILLVVLKGRQDHLQRWVRTGSTGDRDSTWARLLTEGVPPCLLDDATSTGRARTYRRLRTELSEHLPPSLRALGPLLHDIAELPTGRRLRGSFEARVQPVWNRAIPFPRSGFPTFVRNATDAVKRLNPQEDAR